MSSVSLEFSADTSTEPERAIYRSQKAPQPADESTEGFVRRAAVVTARTATAEFPPFRLDPVNQCLWRCGESGEPKRICLTPKAFALLHYLVKHAGRLVTQDELLGAIWPGCCVQPEVLKSQILDIRRILQDDPKNPRFIETLPRRGYQFIAAINEIPANLIPSQGAGDGRLVGRHKPLSQLGAALQTALRGQRQLVFVTGPTGIGKTALVDTFQHHVNTRAPFICVGRGQCLEGYAGTEAFYPMLEALGQLCRGSAGTSLLQVLAKRAPTWLVQFPEFVSREHRQVLQGEILGTTRERMLREIAEFIEAIAAETPLILIFEDLHRADHSTVDLLSVLARRRNAAKLMLIGTYSPGDIGATDRPLRALKRELAMHHLCREIGLPPLREQDICQYLSGNVADAIAKAAELAGLIYRYTEGNPLFMVTVLEHLRDRKLVALHGSVWTLEVPIERIELRTPESLRQMIEVQIGRLSDEERRVLEAGSVTGSMFSIVVGAACADMDPDRFEELCEGLARKEQVVRPTEPLQLPDGAMSERYGFVHSMYGEVLYTRQAPSRRAKLHLRASARIAALYSQCIEEAAADLAHHCERGGDWQNAIKYLQLTAENSARRFGPRQAAAILEHALDLVSRVPVTQRAELEVTILERAAVICDASFGSRKIDGPRVPSDPATASP